MDILFALRDFFVVLFSILVYSIACTAEVASILFIAAQIVLGRSCEIFSQANFNHHFGPLNARECLYACVVRVTRSTNVAWYSVRKLNNGGLESIHFLNPPRSQLHGSRV